MRTVGGGCPQAACRAHLRKGWVSHEMGRSKANPQDPAVIGRMSEGGGGGEPCWQSRRQGPGGLLVGCRRNDPDTGRIDSIYQTHGQCRLQAPVLERHSLGGNATSTEVFPRRRPAYAGERRTGKQPVIHPGGLGKSLSVATATTTIVTALIQGGHCESGPVPSPG